MKEKNENTPTAIPTDDAGLTPSPWKNLAVIYPPYVSATAAPTVEIRAITVPTRNTTRRP